jgi:hypothetical protein
MDRSEQIFHANMESRRLIDLFLFHFRQTEWTLECIPRVSAFGSVDPANMEAILPSNFQDRLLITLVCTKTAQKPDKFI